LIIAGITLTKSHDAFAHIFPAKSPPKEAMVAIYRAANGAPAENLTKVIELMGGIEKIIGSSDVVLIKPNVQWWNQGAPNLSAVFRFVDLIMNRPGGFDGEVVLMENCHRGPSPWNSMGSGWAPRFERNSDLREVSNFNELCGHLKKKYTVKFSVRHLIDVGAGGRRVFRPEDGNGYVYCDGTRGVPLITCENGLTGKDHRVTIITYPILKTDRGTVVDFKNGVWEKGTYTGQPLRFINFSALNYHSLFCGMTSSIKNYMGITDLSGGSDPNNGGRLTKDYFNLHSFSFNRSLPGPVPGMLGAAIGMFMRMIRKADLNITTAEWVGLSSRIDPPVVQTKAVLASTDPVALDYHAAKYVLFPNSRISLHNPDYEKGPLRQYLQKCAEHGGGILDERYVAVKSYDFGTSKFQDDADLVVIGEKQWGSDPKTLLKYMLLRYAPWLLGLIGRTGTLFTISL